MANVFYNRIIRKLVVGFGNLFNDITLVRYNSDQSEQERFIVPIAYAQKELYVQRLQGDPDLEKKVQMTLPRMSFEMGNFSYDASRKQNTNVKQFVQTPAGVISQYNPVPYNFDFSLYIYVRNIEDGTQIIEHILSYFTPDYTVKLNLIPEMGVIKEVPVILNSTSHEIVYEGSRESETRMIIWSLNFTVKAFIFGPVSAPSNTGIITTSITNFYNKIQPTDVVSFTMNANSGIGLYKTGELAFQGYTLGVATASGTVQSFANNILQLVNVEGNFMSTLPIVGSQSLASYTYTSYSPIFNKMVSANSNVYPSSANSSSSWLANTSIHNY